jgi:ABC-type cobalamin/Fe3+-siderophores transport system ATPase subunit
MHTFSLSVPYTDGVHAPPIQLVTGQSLFVLGANGTGKSSLLQRFTQGAQGQAKRISASRQTWLQSSALEFSPAQKQQIEDQARNWDNNQQSRWMEQNAQYRSGLTLYDLIDAENIDARAIASAMRAGDLEKAETLARATAPLAKLNELFALSNIPINISVEGGSRLVASKNGSAPYGAAELSDGERNALLIAADVLTAKPNSLLIIDEPERHLHRSIISPLLTQLFREQASCAFVVATHDLMLPVDNPEARVLLVRSCSYQGSYAQGWDTDLLPANADIDEVLKEDIVGARRRIVFIEGEESSLDQPLYSVLFPEVSIRSKGSSRDVEHSVSGVRSSENVHWVRAWGIIDNDGRDPVSVATLQAQGIYALPFYSVESIYFHPIIIQGVARRNCKVIGGDAEAKAQSAIAAAVAAVAAHVERMAARSVEKSVRRAIFSGLPTLRSIEQKQPISINVDTAAIVDSEISVLNVAISQNDWIKLLTKCPIRETPALSAIARAVGLRDHYQYESAVLQMLREELDMLQAARSFFGALPLELGVTA